MRREDEKRRKLIVGLYLLIVLGGVGLGASFGYIQKMIPRSKAPEPNVIYQPEQAAKEGDVALDEIILDEEIPQEFYDPIRKATESEKMHLEHETAVGATAGEDAQYLDSRRELMEALEGIEMKMDQ